MEKGSSKRRNWIIEKRRTIIILQPGTKEVLNYYADYSGAN